MTDGAERPRWATLIAELRGKTPQKLLAETAGISAGYLGMIETGERAPSQDVLESIADALGLKGKTRADLLASVPRQPRPVRLPERVAKLEQAVAELAMIVERLDAESTE